jgi:hypothetical protein
MHLLRLLLVLSTLTVLTPSHARQAPPGVKKESGSQLVASSGSTPAPSYVPYWPYDRCSNVSFDTTLSDAVEERMAVEFNNMISTHQIDVSAIPITP